MSDIKTVDESNVLLDPIYQRQKEDVTKMRTSLLSCTEENGMPIQHAINSITAMRIYHYLTQVIRYLEMMDKLEDKLYRSVDYTLNTSPDDAATMIMLLNVQKRVQKNMAESYKLLQQFMGLQEYMKIDIPMQSSENVVSSQIMESEARDRLRVNAQAALTLLKEQVG